MEENSEENFIHLLENLSTVDNQLRARAEQQYEGLRELADGFLPFSLLTVSILMRRRRSGELLTYSVMLLMY